MTYGQISVTLILEAIVRTMYSSFPYMLLGAGLCVGIGLVAQERNSSVLPTSTKQPVPPPRRCPVEAVGIVYGLTADGAVHAAPHFIAAPRRERLIRSGAAAAVASLPGPYQPAAVLLPARRRRSYGGAERRRRRTHKTGSAVPAGVARTRTERTRSRCTVRLRRRRPHRVLRIVTPPRMKRKAKEKARGRTGPQKERTWRL